MFYAHVPDVEKVFHLVLACKVAAGFGLLGSLDVFVGNKVVEHDGNFVYIKHRIKSSLVKLVDRHRCGDIVAQHHIQLGADQLPGLNRI
ncbi:hypothetical protein SDC9_212008 [bioreactor metagenome]|uniref:Uncharacterized protein n=1 Tax=bioreactor metagenome TaxID=1076179 RepID=A0A645JLJ6_9ZZZZ